MDGNFEKFAKKIRINIIISCTVIGLACGFFAVNAVFLPLKLYGISILWLYYVLIALGGFAIGFFVSFAVLRTDDRKIAKRLDGELALQERVQTALVFGNAESDILHLQRQNAEDALSRCPVKSLRFKNIIATAVCGVIALVGVAAVPVIGYAVPSAFATEEPVIEPEPNRPVTEWEWQALDELIAYVQNSKKAEESVKSGMLVQLQGLRNVLQNGVSASSLSSFVYNTASQIRNVVSDANVSASEEQAALNLEEQAYVINRLYEIFSLNPAGDPDNPNKEPEKPDDGPNGGNNTGSGSLNINKTPFFDPDTADKSADADGHVKCGEVRSEYYERVQKALEEGTISAEEWEYIMLTYFVDLSSDKTEE